VVVQLLVREVDAAVLAVDLPLGADDVVCLVPVVVSVALDLLLDDVALGGVRDDELDDVVRLALVRVEVLLEVLLGDKRDGGIGRVVGVGRGLANALELVLDLALDNGGSSLPWR
jgi:hypothetical protein